MWLPLMSVTVPYLVYPLSDAPVRGGRLTGEASWIVAYEIDDIKTLKDERGERRGVKGKNKLVGKFKSEVGHLRLGGF